MEIKKRAVISVNGRSEEIEAIIDTGSEKTMIDEELLLKLGAPPLTSILVESMGEFRDRKSVYGAAVEIDGCKFALWVTGGKKNLIGHDFLQLAKAIINEKTGEVKLTKNYISY